MAGRKLITTPIFYVNGAPHIGHLYSALLGDAQSRWLQLRGQRVLFMTGTDEHGLKVLQSAEKQGLDPLRFCDQVSATFRTLFERANVEFHDYLRTTQPRHRTAVQHLWTQLRDRGHIYHGQHEGWYSVPDETFVPDSQIVTKETGEKACMLACLPGCGCCSL